MTPQHLTRDLAQRGQYIINTGRAGVIQPVFVLEGRVELGVRNGGAGVRSFFGGVIAGAAKQSIPVILKSSGLFRVSPSQ